MLSVESWTKSINHLLTFLATFPSIIIRKNESHPITIVLSTICNQQQIIHILSLVIHFLYYPISSFLTSINQLPTLTPFHQFSNKQTRTELTYCNDFPETNTSCDRIKTAEIPTPMNTHTHSYRHVLPHYNYRCICTINTNRPLQR